MENLTKYIDDIEKDIVLKAKFIQKYEPIEGMSCEDLAQKFRLRLLIVGSQFNPSKKVSFRTWANKVMRNLVIDLRRKRCISPLASFRGKGEEGEEWEKNLFESRGKLCNLTEEKINRYEFELGLNNIKAAPKEKEMAFKIAVEDLTERQITDKSNEKRWFVRKSKKGLKEKLEKNRRAFFREKK